MGPPSRWDDAAFVVDRAYVRVERRVRDTAATLAAWFDRRGAALLALGLLAYLILFTGMNARYDRARQRASVSRAGFLAEATRGDPSRFRDAMRSFGRVQAAPVPLPPQPGEPEGWWSFTEPNRVPLRDWAARFLSECSRTTPRCAPRCVDDGAFCPRIDMRAADLRRASLAGVDLRGADLARADVRGAELVGADLRGSRLDGAELGAADLRGADLREAHGITCAQLAAARTDPHTRSSLDCDPRQDAP